MCAHAQPDSPWLRINDDPEGAAKIVWLTKKAHRDLRRSHVQGDLFALTLEMLQELADASVPRERRDPVSVKPPQMTWHVAYADGVRPDAPYGHTGLYLRGIPKAVIPYVKSRSLKVKALQSQIDELSPELRRDVSPLQLLVWMLDGITDPEGAGAATIRSVVIEESSTKDEQRLLAGNAGVWMGEGNWRPRVSHWNWRGDHKANLGQTQAEARQWEGMFRARRAALEKLIPRRSVINEINGRAMDVPDPDKIHILKKIQRTPPTSIKVRRKNLGGDARYGYFLASAPAEVLNDWLHTYLWPTAQEPINRFLAYVWMYWHAPHQQVLLPVAIKLRAYAVGCHWLDLWHDYHRRNPGLRGLHALAGPELGGAYMPTRPHRGLAEYAEKRKKRGVL